MGSDIKVSSKLHYTWQCPPEAQVGPQRWICPICQEDFTEKSGLGTHFHQFHLNPHHLSPQDSNLYRLSNFLVRVNEEIEESKKTDFPGLYRCHECFNVFALAASLSAHLAAHRGHGDILTKA